MRLTGALLREHSSDLYEAPFVSKTNCVLGMQRDQILVSRDGKLSWLNIPFYTRSK